MVVKVYSNGGCCSGCEGGLSGGEYLIDDMVMVAKLEVVEED